MLSTQNAIKQSKDHLNTTSMYMYTHATSHMHNYTLYIPYSKKNCGGPICKEMFKFSPQQNECLSIHIYMYMHIHVHVRAMQGALKMSKIHHILKI